MARSRRVDPDYVTDVDRGSSEVASTKVARNVSTADFTERDLTRAGARQLDQAVEALPGLSRAQRDRERAIPRGIPAEVPHPAMQRRLPAPEEVRAPLSSRQRKARSVTKRAVQDRLPQTQYLATAALVSQPARWAQINDALSDAVGDAQELTDAQRREVQRVDRAVQSYEAASDRGHVVYVNVQMPPAVNRGNLAGFVRNQFRPGRVVSFDRFTAAAHTLHEIEPAPGGAARTAVFEIQTRRGAYLGRSDSVDDTAHLLPRGLRLRVVGSHLATYRRPDGSTGTRQIVQLADVDDPTAAPTTSRPAARPPATGTRGRTP